MSSWDRHTIKAQQIIIVRLASQLLGVGDGGLEGGHDGWFFVGIGEGFYFYVLSCQLSIPLV